MLRYLYIIIIVSSVVNCTTLKPSLNKIKPYSFELERALATSPPYVMKFSKHTKTIWYFGAKHENNQRGTTFLLIDKFFASHNPDIVIIEGVETSYGISPTKILSVINKSCTINEITKEKSECGENLYAAMKANSRGIPFIGAEPSDEEQLKIFEQYGFTKEDYVQFWFTNIIPQLYREGKASSWNTLEKEYTTFIKLFSRLINPSDLNYIKYRVWLDTHMPGVQFENLVDSNFSAPILDGNYIQKLSSLIEQVRDKHIVTIIIKYINRYNSVLVVYGHSHFLTQQEALEAGFGKPSILNISD
jgi:hypothetical protein